MVLTPVAAWQTSGAPSQRGSTQAQVEGALHLLRTSVQSWNPKKPALMQTSRSGSIPTCAKRQVITLLTQREESHFPTSSRHVGAQKSATQRPSCTVRRYLSWAGRHPGDQQGAGLPSNVAHGDQGSAGRVGDVHHIGAPPGLPFRAQRPAALRQGLTIEPCTHGRTHGHAQAPPQDRVSQRCDVTCHWAWMRCAPIQRLPVGCIPCAGCSFDSTPQHFNPGRRAGQAQA